MGGRGGAGGNDSGGAGRGRETSLSGMISQRDVDRANAASVTDMGDIIKRTFERNAAEINGLELSESEKRFAVKKMAGLATDALKNAAQAVNPYASGRSRLTVEQKNGSAADRAANARGEMDWYMNELRDLSRSKHKDAESRALSNAFASATKQGAVEVTVNGTRYRRANKRSKTWRST